MVLIIENKMREITKEMNTKKEENLTYEILQKHKKEQERLIIEGKMEKPKRIIRDFTPEEQREFDKGITWEHVFGNPPINK